MPVKNLSRTALIAAGLTDREAAVWTALADHGPSNVSKISRDAALHRPGVYEALEGLSELGFVRHAEGKGRVAYEAIGAAKLAKMRGLSDKALAPTLARLLRQQQMPAMPKDVQVFRGEAIKKVWEELAALPRGATLFRYDGYAAGTKIGPFVPEVYRDALGKGRLQRYVITNKGMRDVPFQKRLECASRMLPGSFDTFEQGVTVFMYGDTFAFVDVTQPMAVIIRNAPLARFQTKLFQYLFRTLRE
jgi:DNA-binding MarR family transcriptional regulator